MKCKICGNEEFYAHQEVRMDVICNGNGDFLDTVEGQPIYDSETPYGPFECTRCGASYEELKDGALVEDLSCLYAPIEGKPGRLAIVTVLRIGNADGRVTVRPFHEELFVRAEPIGNEDIAAAVDDHRIVRSWLAKADACDASTKFPMSMVSEAEVTKAKTIEAASRPKDPASFVTVDLTEAEERFGFYGCVVDGEPRTYILLELPAPLNDAHAKTRMYGAHAYPVDDSEEPITVCGGLVLLVWTGEPLDMDEDPVVIPMN